MPRVPERTVEDIGGHPEVNLKSASFNGSVGSNPFLGTSIFVSVVAVGIYKSVYKFFVALL